MNITWRKAITAAMRLHGETWDDVVAEAPPLVGGIGYFITDMEVLKESLSRCGHTTECIFLYVTMVQSGQTLFLVTLVQRGLLM